MENLISTALESVFTIIGILLAAFAAYFTPKIKRKLESLIDKDNRGIVESVVDMGVELAEKELTGKEGELKLNRAIEYATIMLERYDIVVSNEFVAGAVQTGWRRMNEKQKGQ